VKDLSFPEEVLKSRLVAFQEKISSMGLDGVMLRTLSSFKYFTGMKWLRPALFIPPSGEPLAFVVKGEEQGFMERTWIKNVITFIDGGDLIAKVVNTLKAHKVRKVGMEFGIEKDAYTLFYEMFKKVNKDVEVVDVGPILADMRLLKDDYELNAIREAGRKATKAMEKALDIIRLGVRETEIAAEAYATLYRSGSEEPRVLVNAGPHPRIHSEPSSDSIIKENTFVVIVIAADHGGYYANMARTLFIGRKPNDLAIKAMKCTEEVYERATELTKPGTKFADVIRELDKVYNAHELKDRRIVGYAHGVGLQIEETPITTILPVHRFMEVKPRMVLAAVHSPIMCEGLGQIKKEDTFIVKENGELEKVTV